MERNNKGQFVKKEENAKLFKVEVREIKSGPFTCIIKRKGQESADKGNEVITHVEITSEKDILPFSDKINGALLKSEFIVTSFADWYCANSRRANGNEYIIQRDIYSERWIDGFTFAEQEFAKIVSQYSKLEEKRKKALQDAELC